MKDEDLFDMMNGKLNANTVNLTLHRKFDFSNHWHIGKCDAFILQAFFGGKLKVSGNIGLAMKIQSILPTKPKL